MSKFSTKQTMKKYFSGQSLFEVILALAISTIILVAVVSLVTVAIKNSSFSKNKTLAGRYAQEVTEWLRGERDESWDDFSTNASTSIWCMRTPSWDSIGQCPGTGFIPGTTFRRETFFVFIDPANIEVTVKVYWQEAAQSHETETITNYTDWRTIFN